MYSLYTAIGLQCPPPPCGAVWEPIHDWIELRRGQAAGVLWCIVVVITLVHIGWQDSMASVNRGLPANWVWKPPNSWLLELELRPLIGVHLSSLRSLSLVDWQGTSGVYAEFSPQGHSDNMHHESHPGTLSAKNHESTPLYNTTDGIYASLRPWR